MPACTVSVEIPSGGVAEVPDLTGELTAIDNRTPRHLLIIEQDPPPGTLVGVGAYIITTTVTDQSGNQTVCTNIFCVTAEAGGPFFNTAQSYTATCPAGSTGTPKVAIIAAGAYSSTVSQADADAQALAAAAAQANAALCCCPIGEECAECPDNVYPYGFGYENTYDLYEYPWCYPYLYNCPEVPVFPSSDVGHWWKMEETASAIRKDSIGRTDLTASVISGTIGAVSGKIGNACQQTGSSVNLQYVGTDLIYANTGATLFGWVQVVDASNETSVFWVLTFGGAVGSMGIRLVSGGSANLTVSVEGLGGTPIASTTVIGGVGQWIFYRIWHDGPSGKLRLQLNNGSIFESPTAWTPAAHNNSQIIFNGNTTTRWFDETGFIFRVLTAAEASYLYNGGAGRTWPFA